MTVTLDARSMGRDGGCAYLKERLALPAYCGDNLDALYDCLTALGETALRLTHVPEAAEGFDRVHRVLRAAQRENPRLQIWLEEA